MSRDRSNNSEEQPEIGKSNNFLFRYSKRYLSDLKAIWKSIRTDGIRVGLMFAAKNPETRVTFFTTIFLVLVLISPGNKPSAIYSSNDETVVQIRNSLITAVPIGILLKVLSEDKSTLGTLESIAYIEDEETYASSAYVRFLKLKEANPDWTFDSLIMEIFGPEPVTFFERSGKIKSLKFMPI